MPTLIILGDRDTPFIAPCEYMAKKIPGARLEVIVDAGHSLEPRPARGLQPRAARLPRLAAVKPVELGQVRVENVVEWYGPTRPTWVLPDAAPQAVERHRDWLAPHFMDARGRFLMSIHAFILRTPGLTVLVDTCVGNDKPRENPGWHMLQTDFLDRLAAAGCPPDAVDLVLCTHLHVDHVGLEHAPRQRPMGPDLPAGPVSLREDGVGILVHARRR